MKRPFVVFGALVYRTPPPVSRAPLQRSEMQGNPAQKQVLNAY